MIRNETKTTAASPDDSIYSARGKPCVTQWRPKAAAVERTASVWRRRLYFDTSYHSSPTTTGGERLSTQSTSSLYAAVALSCCCVKCLIISAQQLVMTRFLQAHLFFTDTAWLTFTTYLLLRQYITFYCIITVSWRKLFSQPPAAILRILKLYIYIVILRHCLWKKGLIMNIKLTYRCRALEEKRREQQTTWDLYIYFAVYSHGWLYIRHVKTAILKGLTVC